VKDTQRAAPSRKVRVGAQATARLDLEVSARWTNPSSRGMWGGDALLLSSRWKPKPSSAVTLPTRNVIGINSSQGVPTGVLRTARACTACGTRIVSIVSCVMVACERRGALAFCSKACADAP
jgi:hypothetical protein